MRAVLLVVAVALLCCTSARAGPPSAGTSQVDPCIVTCPAGDSVFAAIVNEGNGAPTEPDREAVLDLCGCPDVRLAPVAGGGTYWLVGCTARTLTGPLGEADFPLAAGGVCRDASINITCDGVHLAFRTAVASFDQDGDLVVGGADLARVDGKLGTSDPTADFDCDGVVGPSDRDIAAAHLGHVHASIVAVGSGGAVEFGARPAPNPGRGAADFILRSPAGGRAVLVVHDLTGRRLATVLDADIEPGVHRVAWSGRDREGRPVAAGLYFYRFTLGTRRSQGMLVLTR